MILNNVSSLPALYHQTFDSIHISNEGNYGMCKAGSAACASDDGNMQFIGLARFQNIGIVHHESAHELTFYYGKKGSDFENKWMAAAGDSYGKYVNPQTPGYLNNGWKDVKTPKEKVVGFFKDRDLWKSFFRDPFLEELVFIP